MASRVQFRKGCWGKVTLGRSLDAGQGGSQGTIQGKSGWQRPRPVQRAWGADGLHVPRLARLEQGRSERVVRRTLW